MKTCYQPYYCYVDRGTPVVLEHKPDRFEELPNHSIVHCPNPDIAEKTLRCNLQIKEWRSK